MYALTIHVGSRARKGTSRLKLGTQLAKLLDFIRSCTSPMFYIPNPSNIHWT
jgi:hypothetical protein